MPWKQIVVRKDSPIRMYSIDPVGANEALNLFEHPALKEVVFNKRIADYHGGYHVDLMQVFGLIKALIISSKTYPSFFQKIAEKYEKLAIDWLKFADDLSKEDYSSLSKEQIEEKCETFFKMYKEYTPIMYVPFAVELSYKEEYPVFLKKAADKFKDVLEKKKDDSKFKELFQKSGILDADDDISLMASIKQIIEIPTGKTFSEEKKESQLKIAEAISKFDINLESAPNNIDVIKESSIKEKLNKSYSSFKWLKQWGYPPFFDPYTEKEYMQEVWRMIPNATQQLNEMTEARANLLALRDVLLESMELNEQDKALVNDISQYNFFRTWRMEVLIKAQYLSVKFLRHIGSLFNLKTNDIFFMTPPEIMELIRKGTLPEDLSERRELWVLQREPEDSIVYSGDDGRYMFEKFISVMDFRENGKSIYIPDSSYVGGKGAALFKLVEGKFEIPPFFVITGEAFSLYVNQTETKEKIKEIKEILSKGSISKADFKKIAKLNDTIFSKGKIPKSVEDGIKESLNFIMGESFAVRSSATIEDSEKLSWAGRFITETFVSKNNIILSLRNVWRSLYSPMVLRYAIKNKVDLTGVKLPVIVQTMINPKYSGVVNTSFSPDKINLLELELIYGEGEGLVSGLISPSTLILDKSSLKIEKKISHIQTKAVSKSKIIDIDEKVPAIEKLNQEMLKIIVETSLKIENYFGKPQDIEFCIDSEDKLWILQSRPITGMDVVAVGVGDAAQLTGTILARGLCGKVRNIVQGIARVLSSPTEGEKFNDGEILVTRAVTPEWDSILYRASGIITNEGGSTCHAVRVANEQGYVAVVGTKSATSSIKDGAQISIDTISDPFEGIVREKK